MHSNQKFFLRKLPSCLWQSLSDKGQPSDILLQWVPPLVSLAFTKKMGPYQHSNTTHRSLPLCLCYQQIQARKALRRLWCAHSDGQEFGLRWGQSSIERPDRHFLSQVGINHLRPSYHLSNKKNFIKLFESI
jgi:hypothetical protein